MKPSLTDLFEVVRQVVAQAWPGRTPRRLVITTAEGDEIALPIPAPLPTEARREQDRLSETERNILTAAEEASGARTGEELSKAAGYQYNGGFRVALSRLRGRGLLSGGPGDSGYQITPAGRQALEQEGRP